MEWLGLSYMSYKSTSFEMLMSYVYNYNKVHGQIEEDDVTISYNLAQGGEEGRVVERLGKGTYINTTNKCVELPSSKALRIDKAPRNWEANIIIVRCMTGHIGCSPHQIFLKNTQIIEKLMSRLMRFQMLCAHYIYEVY